MSYNPIEYRIFNALKMTIKQGTHRKQYLMLLGTNFQVFICIGQYSNLAF